MLTIKRIIFIFTIGILFLSCGLPDVNTIALNLNQPFIMRAIPGDTSVTIEFESQNNEPAFSGYNIYFGDSVNPRLYRIYNEQQQLPTISTNGSANITTHSFTIKEGLYATKPGEEGIRELDENNLANGIPIYIWVSSYQIAPTRESSFVYDFHVAEDITPRFETMGQTVSDGVTMEIQENNLATLVNVGGTFYLRNASGSSMQMRTATSLTDINTAPTTGYVGTDLEVFAGRLYLIKLGTGDWEDSIHGKIFVRSVGATSINVDYCLQTATGILSY